MPELRLRVAGARGSAADAERAMVAPQREIAGQLLGGFDVEGHIFAGSLRSCHAGNSIKIPSDPIMFASLRLAFAEKRHVLGHPLRTLNEERPRRPLMPSRAA